MIRVNLAPLEELEDRHWFMPDLILLVMAVSIVWSVMQLYIGHIETEIAVISDETIELDTNTKRLDPELQRFKDLENQVGRLNEKLHSLEEITVSKIKRYKPIILLEHLQNIKPEGLWFASLIDDSENSVMHLVGGAFDNLLIAEFMAALTSTRLQDADVTDMRSQVYFETVNLQRVASMGSIGSLDNRKVAKSPVESNPISDPTLKSEDNSKAWEDSQKYFPEIAKYPVFQIALKYRDRAGTAASEPSKATNNAIASPRAGSPSEPALSPTPATPRN